MIDCFDGDYAFLSNFYPVDIPWTEGPPFRSVEHAYQASKTISHREQTLIHRCETAGRAKRMASTLTLRPDWAQVKVGIMRDLLMQKFQRPDLAEKLLATDEEFLVEGNRWHDTFWGVCNCSQCAGKGENWLGFLLMEIREEIRGSDASGQKVETEL